MESESDPFTREAVDLFEKEPLKGKWEVNLHTPTKFGEDPSKDLGVHREQTNKHTNKRCSNYSMMISSVFYGNTGTLKQSILNTPTLVYCLHIFHREGMATNIHSNL